MVGEPHGDASREGHGDASREGHGDASREGQLGDPFEVFTGDQASAARLRANLTRIAEDHAGTGVASIAQEVLAGRRPIRDLAEDTQFSAVLVSGVEEFRRFSNSMTPTERTEMVQAARGTLRNDA